MPVPPPAAGTTLFRTGAKALPDIRIGGTPATLRLYNRMRPEIPEINAKPNHRNEFHSIVSTTRWMDGLQMIDIYLIHNECIARYKKSQPLANRMSTNATHRRDGPYG